MRKAKASKNIPVKRVSYKRLLAEAHERIALLSEKVENAEERFRLLAEGTENDVRALGTESYLAALSTLISNTLGDGLTVLSGVRRLCLERKMGEYKHQIIKRAPEAILDRGFMNTIVDGILDLNASQMELAKRKGD